MEVYRHRKAQSTEEAPSDSLTQAAEVPVGKEIQGLGFQERDIL
jgi:hypothetical protein